MIRGAFVICAMLFTAAPCLADDYRTPKTCSYTLKVWNVNSKQSTKAQRVSHPYSELNGGEIDPVTGCTVCEEDQTLISAHGVEGFYVCNKIADKVKAALAEIISSKERIYSVRGYAVIKSRGPVDKSGNRTGFSNHSYGAAIDINREMNGLYDHCAKFGPQCRLVMGGAWRRGNPGTIEHKGAIVKAMNAAGMKWGGLIEGDQKDFMHFSITGY